MLEYGGEYGIVDTFVHTPYVTYEEKVTSLRE